MKKSIALILSIVMMVALMFGCAPAAAPAQTTTETAPAPVADEAPATEPAAAETTEELPHYTIAWTDSNLSNESNAVCTSAAKDYCASLTDCTVDFILLDGEGSGEKQVSQCETLIAQGVDCVIVNPCDSSACQVGVQMCIDAGTNVLVAKAAIDDGSVCTYVGQDDVVAGQMEMKWVAEQLGGKGSIVIIEGPTGHSAAIQRNDGIHKTLEAYPEIEVLYTQPGDWEREKGMSLMENWLQMGKQIDAVVAHNDEMALGAYDALAAAGKTAIVVGIDAIDAAKQSVAASQMNATVLQDVENIAITAINAAIRIAKGEKIEGNIYVDPVVLTIDNVKEY